MYSHPQQGIEKDEVLALRKEGGLWLRQLRQAAGVSQRNLARAIGLDYYTFVSQIESGRGRIPPALVAKWASVLKYPLREFAINLMRFYDPLNYECIFGPSTEPTRTETVINLPATNIKASASTATKPIAKSSAEPAVELAPNFFNAMEDRMNRLETLLARIQE